MLKLKKVQILGFKSFCDRTEVQLEGHGIAAVVGPNGCGKSNISDAIVWVLGEQSARSLRGLKMEDVIFAGTRARRPTGMAEVSLTLVDPSVYGAPEPAIDQAAAQPPELLEDWDEGARRALAAEETEDAVLEAQPGQPSEATWPTTQGPGDDQPLTPNSTAANTEAADGEATVVLKVRRRKFNRTRPAPERLPSHAASFARAKANTCSTAKSAGSATFRTSSSAQVSAVKATPSSVRNALASCSVPSLSIAGRSSRRQPASRASKPRSALPTPARVRKSQSFPRY